MNRSELRLRRDLDRHLDSFVGTIRRYLDQRYAACEIAALDALDALVKTELYSNEDNLLFTQKATTFMKLCLKRELEREYYLPPDFYYDRANAKVFYRDWMTYVVEPLTHAKCPTAVYLAALDVLNVAFSPDSFDKQMLAEKLSVFQDKAHEYRVFISELPKWRAEPWSPIGTPPPS